MSLVIRIPMMVHGVNVLAGYATHGPTMTAAYGLTSRLEDAADFKVQRFGLVVSSYKPRLTEQLTTSLDVILKGKQTLARSATPARLGDMALSLYLEVDEDAVADCDQLMERIALAMNSSRYQGGSFQGVFGTQPSDDLQVTYQLDETLHALVALLKNEAPLAKVYRSEHLKEAAQGDDLITAFADGISRGCLLVCNGFRVAGEVRSYQGQQQKVGDPLYTLATVVPVYQIRRMPLEDQEAALEHFWWSFATESDNHLTIV